MWLVVALTGVLAAGAAGVTIGRTGATRSAALAKVAAPVTARELFAGLPDRLSPPATPTALPDDRAVGRGALLYQINDPDALDMTGALPRWPMYLVTASGEQFSVGLADIVRASQALSPDGRWFAQRRDEQWWIRDLTGTAERAVPPGYELRQWSTDGRSLLLGQPSGADEAYAAFTLPGGEVRPLALRGTSGRKMLAFIGGRELATVEVKVGLNASPRRQLTIAIQDVNGGSARSVSLDTTHQVGPGDIRNAFAPLVRGGGDPPTAWALVTPQEDVPAGKPAGKPTVPPMTLVGVDLRSGLSAGRIDLVVVRGGKAETFLGLAGTEVILQDLAVGAGELVAVNPVTGTRRVLSSLPHRTRVILPGG
ncbi:hypothetical protein [Micromonospora parva]|uniref:Uncharacterized protein n=1 Tax=Micromonospora parva TaxID=1464048 RepID=A0ABW6VP43_9ACTN